MGFWAGSGSAGSSTSTLTPVPFGLIVGVLLGTVAAIFLVVKTASRFSDQAQKRSPGEPVPFDDEDET